MTPTPYRQLRNPQDAALRLKAVRALGELDRIDDAPLLIRAAVEDPDGAVRSAAREALLGMIGAETELAISTYRNDPDDEPWLVELEEDDDEGEDEDEALSFEDDQYLTGVISILRNHPDARLRLKAIAEMSQNSDLRVIAALAETVLWTDDDELRKAALQSLEARFGEDTQTIIQTYQMEGGWDDEDEDEEDLEEWPEEEEAEIEEVEPDPPSQTWHAPVVGASNTPRVVREEGFPWLLVVIAALVIGVMVMALLLSLR